LNYNPRNHISRGKEEYEHEYRGKNYSKLLWTLDLKKGSNRPEKC
jgi:hypothetical protein